MIVQFIDNLIEKLKQIKKKLKECVISKNEIKQKSKA